jgi:hypothetical protein
LVGAREAGKTTVLELVRFVLGLPSSNPKHQHATNGLVAGNLESGRVRVTVRTKEGLNYIVSRAAGEEPVVIQADETPTEINLRTAGLCKVDVFSQNEVEAIADRAESQLALIDDFAAECSHNHFIAVAGAALTRAGTLRCRQGTTATRRYQWPIVLLPPLPMTPSYLFARGFIAPRRVKYRGSLSSTVVEKAFFT